ncbi:hypothetical protein GGI07_001705 [Coemansia sp. Benny D115]|nr:hypothetical protein GGI07_001705 [Coemansia sp. Benny D115]
MSSSPGNNNGSNTDIPKIQLESKEDAHFLQAQLTDYLTRSLDSNTALRDGPFTAEQRAEARQLVLDRLNKWTSEIWDMAGQSISINGFSFDEAMQEKSRIEPLDEGLKSEVQGLREEADALLLSVTEKRRTVPMQIERLGKDAVWRESVAAENTTEIKGLAPVQDDGLPYVDDRVNGEFEAALKTARKLGETAESTRERVERVAGALEDTRERVLKDAESDARVRRVLLGNAPASSVDGMSAEAQALAHKAALHAICTDTH